MNSIADQLFIRLQSRFPKMNIDAFEGISLMLLREKNLSETLDTLSRGGAMLLETAWDELDQAEWALIVERASAFMPKRKKK